MKINEPGVIILGMKRSADYPFLADWLAITLRWTALLGVTSSLAFAGELALPLAGVLFVSALWNLSGALIAIINFRLPGHRLINVFVDLIISTLLFIFSGGIEGRLIWASLFVIFTTAVYFEWVGGLIVAILASILQIVYAYFTGSLTVYYIPIIIVTLFNLFFGLSVGFLGRFAIQNLRNNYFLHVRRRDEEKQRFQKVERSRLQTFSSMVETLSATLNYQVVLETALNLCDTAIGAQNPANGPLVSAVLLFEEEALKFGASHHMPATDTRLKLPARQGILLKTIQSGDSQFLEKPSEDPELSQLFSLKECGSVFLLPLNRGLNFYGVMLFAHAQPTFFSNEKREVLDMVSHQAVIAIQNARLYQDVQEEKQRIVQSQEEAQKKLARDLHDGPIQSVSGIVMRIDISRRLMQKSIPQADEELAKVQDLARRTTQELRHMLFTLRPLVLETEGLIPALNTIAEKMRDVYQQNVEIDADQEVVEKLELNKQTVIFYIVEEATNNARKHAQASLIQVKLKFLTKDKSLVLLEIIDNGVGFDLDKILGSYEKRGSLGMVNLRERTDLVNGLLHIDSTPGKGTKIDVVVPLTEEASDRLQRGLISNQKS